MTSAAAAWLARVEQGIAQIDQGIAIVAPRFARRRQLARMAYQATAKRAAFEAAGTDRRAAGWTRGDGGPQHDAGELSILRARSRDMRRNNPYARRAIDAIVSNAVGQGIRGRVRNANGSTNARLQKLWDEWAGSTAVDADGRCTFAGMQRLALASTVESGECLVRLRRRRMADGFDIPIQLQALEADYLEDDASDLLRRPTAGANRVVQGIELDRIGNRVAYWLYKEHPGCCNTNVLLGGDAQTRIPADEIAHMYRLDRPGQMRGVPWLAPVLRRLHDLDAYEDAQLERQRVASQFACFVRDDTGTLDPALAAASQQWEMPEYLEPGGMIEMPPGRNVEFSDPPEAHGFADYLKANLHAIGAGVGVPYMLLTGDLSSANFSSSRMGRLEFQRQIREWHDGIVFPFCDRVFAWWLDAMAYAQGVDVDNVRVEWSAPRPEMVDPQKETTAIADRIRNGLTSYPRALREQGDDPAQVLAEIAEWNAELDELGIVLDCDARQQTKAGQSQVTPSGDGEDAPADDAPDDEVEGEEADTVDDEATDDEVEEIEA